jgi:hypothetical protein
MFTVLKRLDQEYIDMIYRHEIYNNVNPLNAKLNSICQLLALLGAHHIFHISRIGVKMCKDKIRKSVD